MYIDWEGEGVTWTKRDPEGGSPWGSGRRTCPRTWRCRRWNSWGSCSRTWSPRRTQCSPPRSSALATAPIAWTPSMPRRCRPLEALTTSLRERDSPGGPWPRSGPPMRMRPSASRPLMDVDGDGNISYNDADLLRDLLMRNSHSFDCKCWSELGIENLFRRNWFNNESRKSDTERERELRNK